MDLLYDTMVCLGIITVSCVLFAIPLFLLRDLLRSFKKGKK